MYQSYFYHHSHNILILYQISLSPQVKRSPIISNKLGRQEFPHELPNDLKLRILGIQDISGKSQNFIELQPSAQSSSQNKNFFSTSKKLLKNRNCTFPVVLHFTRKLTFVSSNSPIVVDQFQFTVEALINRHYWAKNLYPLIEVSVFLRVKDMSLNGKW